MNYLVVPKRVCVEISPGVYALGDFKFATADGRYVVHLDGELADHVWQSDSVEFLEDGGLN